MIDGREKWKCQFGFKLQNSPVFEKTSAVSIKRHDNKFNCNTIFIKIQTLRKVLIKCLQRAKTPATWRFELSTFWGNGVKRKSEA